MPVSSELLEHVSEDITPLARNLAEALAALPPALAQYGTECRASRDLVTSTAAFTSRLAHWRKRGVALGKLDPVSGVLTATGRDISLLMQGLFAFAPGPALFRLRAALLGLLSEINVQLGEGD